MQSPKAEQWHSMLPKLPVLPLPNQAPGLFIRHRPSLLPILLLCEAVFTGVGCITAGSELQTFWDLSYCIN